MAGDMRRETGSIIAETERVCTIVYKFPKYKFVREKRFVDSPNHGFSC